MTWTATFTATDGVDDHRLGDGDAGGYTDAVGNIGGRRQRHGGDRHQEPDGDGGHRRCVRSATATTTRW